MAIAEHILNHPFLFLIQHKSTGQFVVGFLCMGFCKTFLDAYSDFSFVFHRCCAVHRSGEPTIEVLAIPEA